jgi:hypothetical protein
MTSPSWAATAFKYNPSELRVGAGSTGGGQFTAGANSAHPKPAAKKPAAKKPAAKKPAAKKPAAKKPAAKPKPKGPSAAQRSEADSLRSEAKSLNAQASALETKAGGLEKQLAALKAKSAASASSTPTSSSSTASTSTAAGAASTTPSSSTTSSSSTSTSTAQETALQNQINSTLSQAKALRAKAKALNAQASSMLKNAVPHITKSGRPVATIVDSPEVTVSFPITKTEATPEGDLLVYGKATDGSLDSDDQIVDSAWSAAALEKWISTGGNVRVQHNPSRDPAGVGMNVEINKDGDGAHWVKALIVEQQAQKLVKAGALRAFSVGIMRPKIVTDNKARGGRIVGGEIGELSLVDRPANRNCGITLVKSGKSGNAEAVEDVWGEEVLEDKAPSPADVAKMIKNKLPMVEQGTIPSPNQHFFSDPVSQRLSDELNKRKVNTAERQRLAGEGKALPDGSYPIANAGDLQNAAVLAQSGHGNASAAKKLIARRAQELGVANPLSSSNKADSDDDGNQDCPTCKGTGKIRDGNVTCPDCHGSGDMTSDKFDAEADAAKAGKKTCPDCGKSYHADSKMTNCANCGAKLPVAKAEDDDLGKGKKKPANDDSDGNDADADDGDSSGDGGDDSDGGDQTDDDADDEGTGDDYDGDKAAKPKKLKCSACATKVKKSAKFCPSCGASFIGKEDAAEPEAPAEKAVTSEPAPVQTWELKARETDAPYAMMRAHDALCAAYAHQDVLAEYPSLKSIGDALDVEAWQAQALDEINIKGDLVAGEKMLRVASAMKQITGLDQAMVADARASLHKDFTSMYPDVHLSPGQVSAQQFTRPYVSDGHAPLSKEPPMPQPSASTPPAAPNADSFTRGPLTSGEASASPGDGPAVSAPAGGPTRVYYTNAAKDAATAAMAAVHDHIAHAFPGLCPMSDTSSPTAMGTGVLGTSKVISEAMAKAAPGQKLPVMPEVEAVRPRANKVAKVKAAAKSDGGAVTPKAFEGMLEKALTPYTDRLAEMQSLLEAQRAETAELHKQLDVFGAQPDPLQAPHRGMLMKDASVSGAEPVERRSLVDEAAASMHDKKFRFLKSLAQSGDPVIREQAQAQIHKMLQG